MKFLFSILVAICLFPGAADAQKEYWDTYMTIYDNKPASVLVDMELMHFLQQDKYPILVVTGPVAQRCDSMSLPEKEEIDALENILSATNDYLTQITAKVLAGTFSHNCQRLNYYYVKDTTGIRNALARMYKRKFKDYNYVVKIKNDPAWKVYRTLLYPDEITALRMENNRKLATMKADGDSLNVTRDVQFNFYFYSDSGRKSFIGYAAAKGYTQAKLLQAMEFQTVYGLVISRQVMMRREDINVLTEELAKEAKKNNGYFEGWLVAVKSNVRR